MELAGYLAHAATGEIFGWRRKRDSAELLSEIEPWRAQRDYDGFAIVVEVAANHPRTGSGTKSSLTRAVKNRLRRW